jgi:hypothetical protein
MSLAYYLPNWFFVYDLILELSFSIILVLVSILAFRIYKITMNNQVKLLGIGFSFIALSNFLESIMNILVILKTESLVTVLNNIPFSLLNDLNVYSHIGFRLIGLTILLYMTFKIEKIQLLLLMLITPFFILFLSKEFIYSYYIISTIYLVFITANFVSSYIKSRQFNTLLITLAFIFLTMDGAIFVLWNNHELSYVIGHLPELIAYLLILLNFKIVRRK